MPNIIHSGGGVNIMTLPDQITNLACVGGTDGAAGTIDVQFTESSSTSWSLLKNYVLVYKAGSIPQTPFDGARIVLPKSTAGAQKTYQITGLTFDQLYGVRIYPVSTKYQHQTAAEGATATATPINGIRLDSLIVGTATVSPDRIKFLRGGSNRQFNILKQNYENSGGILIAESTLFDTGIWDASSNNYNGSDIDIALNSTYYNSIDTAVKNKIINVNIKYTSSGTTVSALSRKVFALSATELCLSNAGANVEGSSIPYFSNGVNRGKYGSSTLVDYYTRSRSNTASTTNVFIVYTGNDSSGALSSVSAYTVSSWNRAIVAMVLPADMLFDPTPDADGCYIPL